MKECKHNSKKALYDHHVCLNCGRIKTDSFWHNAKDMWFDNLSHAKFFDKNGFLPKNKTE